MTVLVSVLVPLYNHEHYIGRCLDSVLGDSHANKEIIIIDDGSTDASKAAVEQWMRCNPVRPPLTLISRPNRGLTATLNELIALANGQYIKMLASDDYIVADGIAACAAYLTRHSECDAVFGDAIMVDETNVVTSPSCLFAYRMRQPANYLDARRLRREIILRWSVPGPVLCLRSDFLRRIGGFDEHLVIEDWDLFLRILAGGTLAFVNHPVAAYRLHADNASRVVAPARRVRNLKNMVATADKHLAAFGGAERGYLAATRALYLAKIAYLQRDKLRCAGHLAAYAVTLCAAHLGLARGPARVRPTLENDKP